MQVVTIARFQVGGRHMLLHYQKSGDLEPTQTPAVGSFRSKIAGRDSTCIAIQAYIGFSGILHAGLYFFLLFLPAKHSRLPTMTADVFPSKPHYHSANQSTELANCEVVQKSLAATAIVSDGTCILNVFFNVFLIIMVVLHPVSYFENWGVTLTNNRFVFRVIYITTTATIPGPVFWRSCNLHYSSFKWLLIYVIETCWNLRSLHLVFTVIDML